MQDTRKTVDKQHVEQNSERVVEMHVSYGAIAVCMCGVGMWWDEEEEACKLCQSGAYGALPLHVQVSVGESGWEVWEVAVRRVGMSVECGCDAQSDVSLCMCETGEYIDRSGENDVCEACSVVDADCSGVEGRHGGWHSTCDGTRDTDDAECVNPCMTGASGSINGLNTYWDDNLGMCVECALTNETCATLYGHGGWHSTCDGSGAVDDGVCMNRCNYNEVWNETSSTCTPCQLGWIHDVETNGSVCIPQGVTMRMRGHSSYVSWRHGGRSIAVGQSGSVYVGGSLDSGIGLDNFDRTSTDQEIFYTRIDVNGTASWLWTSNVAYTGNVVKTAAVGVDANETILYSGRNLWANNEVDVVITATNALEGNGVAMGEGGEVWRRELGTSGVTDEVRDIAVDAHGNVYAGAYFGGSLSIGEMSFVVSGGRDAIVVKYDASGTVLYARQSSGVGRQHVSGIDVNDDGIVAYGGNTDSPLSVGLDGASSTYLGSWDAWVVVMDSNNVFLWANQYGSSARDNFQDVAVAPDGTVVTCGLFFGTGVFGGAVVSGSSIPASNDATSVTLTSDGSKSAFVMSRSVTGAFKWAKAFGTESGFRGVTVDEHGHVYVCGFFQSSLVIDGTTRAVSGSVGRNMMVLKLNESDGSVMWVQTVIGVGESNASDIVAFGPYVYVTGAAQGTITLGDTIVLESSGAAETTAFVMTLRRSDGSVVHRCRNAKDSNSTYVIEYQSPGGTSPLMPTVCSIQEGLS